VQQTTDPRDALRALVHQHRDAVIAALREELAAEVAIGAEAPASGAGPALVVVVQHVQPGAGGLAVTVAVHVVAADPVAHTALGMAVEIALGRRGQLDVDGVALDLSVRSDDEGLRVVVGG
jgi:hypothetical protein